MKCKNFGCEREASEGYGCCDAQCGYYYGRDLDRIKKIFAGMIIWDEAVWGISYWSVGKYEYYRDNFIKKLIYEQ